MMAVSKISAIRISNLEGVRLMSMQKLVMLAMLVLFCGCGPDIDPEQAAIEEAQNAKVQAAVARQKKGVITKPDETMPEEEPKAETDAPAEQGEVTEQAEAAPAGVGDDHAKEGEHGKEDDQ